MTTAWVLVPSETPISAPPTRPPSTIGAGTSDRFSEPSVTYESIGTMAPRRVHSSMKA